MNEFGNYLREIRGKRSLREMERITGLSHTYLSSLEKGYDPRSKKERTPTPEAIKKIATGFKEINIHVDYLELMHMAGHIPEVMTLDDLKKREKELKKVLRMCHEESEMLHKRRIKVEGSELEKLEDELLMNNNLTEEILEELDDIWNDIRRRELDEFFDSMSSEEFDDYLETQRTDYLIGEYRRVNYPDLAEILKDGRLFFEKSPLTIRDKEIIYSFLKSMLGDRGQTYPSDEEIKTEFYKEQKFIKNLEELHEKATAIEEEE